MTEKTFPTAEDFQYVKSNASWGDTFHELSIGLNSEEEYEPLKQQIIQDHEVVERLKAELENIEFDITKTQAEIRGIGGSLIESESKQYLHKLYDYSAKLKSILESKK